MIYLLEKIVKLPTQIIFEGIKLKTRCELILFHVFVYIYQNPTQFKKHDGSYYFSYASIKKHYPKNIVILSIKKGLESVTALRFFKNVSIGMDGISFEFSNEFISFFENKQAEKFVYFNLQTILNLRTKYGISLYHLTKIWSSTGLLKITRHDLYRILNIRKKETTIIKPCLLKRDYLNRAIEDINNNSTDIKITNFEWVEKGRHNYFANFKFIYKPNQINSVDTQPKPIQAATQPKVLEQPRTYNPQPAYNPQPKQARVHTLQPVLKNPVQYKSSEPIGPVPMQIGPQSFSCIDPSKIEQRPQLTRELFLGFKEENILSDFNNNLVDMGLVKVTFRKTGLERVYRVIPEDRDYFSKAKINSCEQEKLDHSPEIKVRI